ncbi:uncharacterized protein LOC126670101 [Mercurialis annua]|uniref:uncharacterized protein LOC126670101 n=1 Tax=Mercurialis annua TaxID=3986 RepID=UPI00215F401D|nr:uncharacterized protein LOC126670101 [Mercurialis annua]
MPVQAATFEIKPSTIQLLENRCAFYGLSHEDPNAHIASFLGVLNTFKLHGITADQTKLRMFPVSLRDKASLWLHSLPNESIRTWRELAQAFLNKYFPHGKTTKLTKDILEFVQFEGESLYEAWERFKDLQRSVPHHRLNREHVIQIFYDGTTITTRGTIDAASGGSLMQKTYEEALDLVEKLAIVSSTWGPIDRRAPSTQKSLMTHDQVKEMEAIKAINTSLQAQVDALKRQLNPRNAPVAYVQVGCEFCRDFNHSGGECLVTGQALSEQVNYIGGQRQGNAQGSNQVGSSFQGNNRPPQQQGHYEGNQGQGYNYGGRPQHPPGFQPQRNVDDGNVLYKVLEKLDKMEQRELDARQREKNQASTIHHLETQISQLAINLQGRPQGGLPSTTETNPREHVKAIKVVELRSGRVLDVDHNKDFEKANGKRPMIVEVEPQVVIDVASSSQELPKSCEEVAIDIDVEEPYVRPPPPPPFVPKVPFPSRLRKAPDNKKFHKFLEIFKKLQISMSLGDALREMPQYAKKICGNQPIKQTSMMLQLADHSLKRPHGVAEDVLVKVGKFIFPVDFVVLDSAVDKDCPMILGRPFLNTGRALVDVNARKITLRMNDESMVFDIKHGKSKCEEEKCMKIDTIEPTLHVPIKEVPKKEPEVVCAKIETTPHIKPRKGKPKCWASWKLKLNGIATASKRQICMDVATLGEYVQVRTSQAHSHAGKLISKWSRPFKIRRKLNDGLIELEGANGDVFKVLGEWCKPYPRVLIDENRKQVALFDPP